MNNQNDRTSLINILIKANIPFSEFHDRIEITAKGDDKLVEGYEGFCTIIHFNETDCLDKLGIYN